MTKALQNIYEEVEKRTIGFEIWSQLKEKDPLVICKLFDIYGTGIWYITESCLEERVVYGYVERLLPYWRNRKWRCTSLDELVGIKYLLEPRIKCDIHFKPKRFSEIGVRE